MALKPEELQIYSNLRGKFVTSSAFASGMDLIAEARCWLGTPNQVRHPDICVLSANQIRSATSTAPLVPLFVIELISPSNSSNEVEKKMHEYFTAGVRLIRHVYPELKRSSRLPFAQTDRSPR